MGISHVIRGDDHLNNAFRQTQIYKALGWALPEFAHIPLIHDASGAKMSKRRGTVAVDAYRDLGYLPEALRNYLLRLGWSHGDDEIISTAEAIEWFDIADVNRGAARFDQAKLDSVNAHYIRETDDARLVALVVERLAAELGHALSGTDRDRLTRAMPALKPRAKTIAELADKARFYVAPRPIRPADAAAKLLTADARSLLGALSAGLADSDWDIGTLEARLRDFVAAKGIKLGAVAQPLRVALTGSLASPGIFEVMDVLGRDETLARLRDAAESR
jgi:glutamyl-tRNA synthetase